MSPRENFHEADVVVIGAGPAGLAATTICLEEGYKVCVIEEGVSSSARSRNEPKDIVSGVGGAGLYSDGKFSFLPSATMLWKLLPRKDLRKAYSCFVRRVAHYGLAAPEYPVVEDSSRGMPTTGLSRHSYEKKYTSIYMPLINRKMLVENMERECASAIRLSMTAKSIGIAEPYISVDYETAESHKVVRRGYVRTRVLLICSGRFGGILLKSQLPANLMSFRRLEYGIRIEQPSKNFFLSSSSQVDPKLVFVDQMRGLEWRTFCCCREGEVIRSVFAGLSTLSGRADIGLTGWSNTGFNLRVKEEQLGNHLWNSIVVKLESLQHNVAHFRRVSDFRIAHEWLVNALGRESATYLCDGLRMLYSVIGGHSLDDVILHSPTLEGIGYYPKLTTDLKLRGYPVWVAGDCTGVFRGLTAAMVSGYFVGLRAVEALRK